MDIEKFLSRFLPIFAITFAANFIISTIFNLISYWEFFLNWEGPFLLALTLGIVLPIIETKKKEN